MSANPYRTPSASGELPPDATPAAAAHASKVTAAGQYMALGAALLGWMFDGAEMGVFSMVGRPALRDLMAKDLAGVQNPEPLVGFWFGVIIASFLIGAATGGVLFGWLGDRIGRVRAMTLSVLTYALFTGLCGFAAEAWQLGVLRFIAALGMGGEWSLGVALVMEVWPNRSRAFMAGLIGAAANVGYLLVGFVGLALNQVLEELRSGLLTIGLGETYTNILLANGGWRVMMILGTAPALLTFLIRLFVPESEKWEAEKESGGTSNWASRDLLGVMVGALGPFLTIVVWATPAVPMIAKIVVTVLGVVVATAGYIYPVVRYLQRHRATHGGDEVAPIVKRMLLAACLSGVALLGTWGSTQSGSTWADKLTDKLPAAEKLAASAKEWTQISLAFGAIVGTILAALMGDWLGRRNAYFLLCVLSLASVAMFFQPWNPDVQYGPMLLFWAFVAGTCTASFYGWLPLYLPELFRTNVRATGQGFGFNFGRILAAVGTLQLGNLVAATGGYPTACTALSLIYVVGMIIIWLAPETKGQPLPD